MAHPVRRSAHAKLNLALRVWPAESATSARPGWHRILSWTACIGLCDDLELEPGGAALVLNRTWSVDAPLPGPIDWPVEQDLVIRAVRALESHLGRALPCRVNLTKRIPAGAGLGGGSSDAAAALLACSDAFGLGLSAQELRELGSRLGSDVPFFIDDAAPARPALVSHFGDALERVAPLAGDVTLFMPGVACSTPEVYRAFDAAPHGPPHPDEIRRLQHAARLGQPDDSVLVNDLADAACRIAPQVGEAWRCASRLLTPRHLRMSGSGSTLWLPGRLDPADENRLREALGLGAVVHTHFT
ncbi:MAG: hypothetical protein IT439_08455 [Phycisphaerales bacterium]|nr:hypothetical protein [Phycisphaerales bacterium]